MEIVPSDLSRELDLPQSSEIAGVNCAREGRMRGNTGYCIQLVAFKAHNMESVYREKAQPAFQSFVFLNTGFFFFPKEKVQVGAILFIMITTPL